MGEFTGFKFGGYASSDLGITRVSGGDRYDESLHPEIKDRTAEVPGLNGQYYFGSDYGPKQIDIEFAFDHLTEMQFRLLRTVFGTKQIQELIFDERPYKKYMVKLESPIELSFVCFDEPIKTVGEERDGLRFITQETPAALTDEAEVDSSQIDNSTTTFTRVRERVTPYITDYSRTERIYKGEGKASFICHFPFAKSVFKQLNSEDEDSDWAVSSGILPADLYEGYDTFTILEDNNYGIKLYNPGDIETPCRIYCPFDNTGKIDLFQINYISDALDNNITGLKLQNVEKNIVSNDIGILINTETGLIQGVTSLEPLIVSPYLYNKYMLGGSFFKIQPSISLEDNSQLIISGITEGVQIFYDYLYF